MKAIIGKKLLAKNVRDCKGFYNAVGLRFKKTMKPFDAYLIHVLPDSVLDSFFVPIKFIAVWLDKESKVLKIETCKKNKFFAPIKNQYLVLELPIENKIKIKTGDKILLKASNK